ncbi:MAG TPA: sulfite oxidase-like oxidoreductase [Acidimicrobiia bacterium]|nr:sulfite oxidase-like oxidoreductase [Acidimicrobiia bacterium]
MAFFKGRDSDLAAAGIDPARVPPGQYVTDRFPVLHAGSTPKIDIATWDFTVEGLVAEGATFTLDQIKAMPASDKTHDIHCVTKWSKLETAWHGVEVVELMSRFEISPTASHVLVRAEHGFTANLPLDDFLRPDNLLAWQYGGEDLELDHGWPLRLVVPHLYFWKSVKWVRGFRFLDHDEPGFWERNGYHMYGDPFREQRYWGD